MKLNTLASNWLLLHAVTAALILPRSHVEHESLADHEAHSWVKRSRLEKHIELPVRIGLTQSNLDRGHDMLMSVSDPHSPDYGRHFTSEDVEDLFAPSYESEQAVRQWILSHGINDQRISTSANKQWLQFDATAAELEGLLLTEYHIYEHTDGDKQTFACNKYHVPKDIQSHIDFIKPGVLGSFPSMKLEKRAHPPPALSKRSSTPLESRSDAAQKPCAELFTPACYKKLYNVTDTIQKLPENPIGVFESQGIYYNGTDMDLFFKTYASNIKQGTRPTFKPVDGAPEFVKPVMRATTDRSEADLDLQVIYPLVYPDEVSGLYNVFLDAVDGSYCTKTAFGITGNTPKYDGVIPNPHKGGYKGKLQCGKYKLPKVMSISYTFGESFYSVPYQRRMCQEFLKLGLQGTSFFYATGDLGVGPGDCFKKPPNHAKFTPNFPVNCPYITAVGGTRLPPGVPVRGGSEKAVNNDANGSRGAISGGGFSNVFPRPAYQDSAVQNYFDKHNPPWQHYSVKYNNNPGTNYTGRYNRIGRGYPDVSAIGKNVAVVEYAEPAFSGGTSAAAPLWAAIVHRINNHRLRANKTSLGFINPSLYKNPGMLNDILEGDNPGCYKTNPGYDRGFLCARGWDPVTGLGSPNYGKMLDYYMSLP